MLAEGTETAYEVGPGASSLEVAPGRDPREGPLAALALGARALAAAGFAGPALVLATDLPRLTPALLGTIAAWPSPPGCSVAPVVAGRPQFLCARWSPAALAAAVELASAGERRVQAAFSVGEAHLVGPDELPSFDLEVELGDADDEAALRRLGFGALFRT